jgi:hypothetical protein
MNAERLHIVASTLKQELSTRKTADRLRVLVNALKSIVQANNESTQQALVQARESFYTAVTDTTSDSFTRLGGKFLLRWVARIYSADT